jgi:heterodisulfide reductase subunit A-like polyferredoxin
MSVNVKRKIVIVGGGTAGWIAANLINRHWSELGIEVCLVESPDIGTIGGCLLVQPPTKTVSDLTTGQINQAIAVTFILSPQR